MLVKQLTLGQLGTNCYILTDENTLSAAVIDPGAQSSVILDYIEEQKLNVEYIFLTHGHFDHTMAAAAIQKATGAPLYINENDLSTASKHDSFNFKPGKGVTTYKEGDRFDVGGLEVFVIETPGHSSGSVTLLCENAIFTGDTLFKDSCGRTDLASGSMQSLKNSLRRLHDLPGDFEVYPGHGDTTTLERERGYNFYMHSAASEKA